MKRTKQVTKKRLFISELERPAPAKADVTTMMYGEEDDGGDVTTLAIGEECLKK